MSVHAAIYKRLVIVDAIRNSLEPRCSMKKKRLGFVYETKNSEFRIGINTFAYCNIYFFIDFLISDISKMISQYQWQF